MRPSFYIFMIVMILIFTALGSWQVKRLEWKQAILASVKQEQMIDAIAYKLTSQDFENLTRHSIKRGTLEGHFIKDKQAILWRGQILNGASVSYLIAPFEMKEGIVMPVVLGSIDTELFDPLTKIPSDTLSITGTAKIKIENIFRPPNNLARNEFYRMDKKDLETYWGVPLTTALFYADEPIIKGVTPVEGLLTIPNNHLYYAIFWFSLAVLISGLTLYQRFKR